MYICYIAWYITGYITLIFIPDLQQPAPPCGCAGAHKNQHPAAPSASSKSLPPAAWLTKSAPASWPQLQPQRPFLAGHIQGLSSKSLLQLPAPGCLSVTAPWWLPMLWGSVGCLLPAMKQCSRGTLPTQCSPGRCIDWAHCFRLK